MTDEKQKNQKGKILQDINDDWSQTSRYR
jgi:hypothetical protein